MQRRYTAASRIRRPRMGTQKPVINSARPNVGETTKENMNSNTLVLNPTTGIEEKVITDGATKVFDTEQKPVTTDDPIGS